MSHKLSRIVGGTTTNTGIHGVSNRKKTNFNSPRFFPQIECLFQRNISNIRNLIARYEIRLVK